MAERKQIIKCSECEYCEGIRRVETQGQVFPAIIQTSGTFTITL